MHLSLLEFLVVFVAVVAGGTVQGSIGFGLNMLAVPIVAIIAPEAIPGAMILPSLPMTLTMATRERAHIDWGGATRVLTGRVPGAIVGLAIVAAVASDVLSVLAGGAVIIAVALSFASGPRRVTKKEQYGTGVLAGLMGTAAAIEGPPVALLYQHHHGRVIRSTLAVIFAGAACMSFTILAVGGQIALWQFWLSLALMPGLGIGLLLAGPITRTFGARSIRPAVLTAAAAAGVLAIGRGLDKQPASDR